MVWQIEIQKLALKELEKLPLHVRKQIASYLEDKLANAINPRDYGHALTGPFAGLWRYRVGKYRMICSISDQNVMIIVIKAGKRDKIYH